MTEKKETKTGLIMKQFRLPKELVSRLEKAAAETEILQVTIVKKAIDKHLKDLGF